VVVVAESVLKALMVPIRLAQRLKSATRRRPVIAKQKQKQHLPAQIKNKKEEMNTDDESPWCE
jgi:hypothetical protein